jgi:hypothetical protein
MFRGVTIAIAGVVLSACTQSAAPPPAAAPTPPAKVSEVGRYVIVHSPQVERDTVLLDTVTGRTWGLVAETDLAGTPYAWVPQPQLNTQADYAALRQDYAPAPKGSKPPSWVVQ